ncbi:hypothetical protein ZWY2020_046798 [Hordeum vulgare]|nr:hypothetical protein ZWY2020_046798 [Hordeum vulgare]
MAAHVPEERLDVLTATGDKTGVSKPRSEVHRGRGLPPRGARVNLLREHRGAATAAPRRLQGLVARPVGHLQRRPRLRMGLLPLLRAYTTVKPLADRVFLKTKTAEQKTTGGILLPSTAQSKPQSGEVVAVGEGRTIGDSKVQVGIKIFCLTSR